MTRFRMKSAYRLARAALSVVATAWIAVGLSAAALAGGGPENVCVAVNSRSWASLAVANEYVHLRQIPAGNVVYLDVPQFDSIDVEKFRSDILLPILKTLEERGIAGQIDCIAYSSDFPTAIDVRPDVQNIELPRIATPTGSLTGLTYLYRYVLRQDPTYLRLDVNQYMRLPRSLAPVGALTKEHGQRLEEAAQAARKKDWATAEERLTAIANQLSGPHPAIEYQLGVMRARQDKLDDAMAALQRAFESGFADVAELQADDALKTLHDRDDFKKLVEAMKSPRIEVQPAVAFHSSKTWNQSADANPQNGDRYLLSTMLAVTSGRGNSVAEAIESLRRSAAADGTRPDGTVYYLANGDVRAKTRQAGFHAAASKLKSMGVKAEVVEGVLPDHKDDVIGAMIGAADFDWAKSGSVMRPGAICEHLTSFGGVLAERSGQTPLTELIRHGAAGASGTVTEPFALQGKFPFAFLHVHYAAGCSLAEAFYQSVQGPYQLLIVGDPLCRPFAKIPPVEMLGVSDGETISDAAGITGRTTPEYRPEIGRWELFVDGRRRGLGDAWAELQWDVSLEAEGHHELRLVGVDRSLVETQGRAIASAFVDPHARKFEVVGPAPADLAWERPVKISARLDGARRITFFQNRREIGAIDGAEGSVEIAPALLGAGPVRLEAVALVTEPRIARVAAKPLDLMIPFPGVLPAQEPPAKLTPGLQVASGDQRIDVLDTFSADWFKKLALPAGAEFTLDGWFEAADDGPMQWQISSNLAVAIEVDGRPLGGPSGEGWTLIPFRAAAGQHHLKISGKTLADANVEPRLSVRLGDRGTSSLDEKRFSHAN